MKYLAPGFYLLFVSSTTLIHKDQKVQIDDGHLTIKGEDCGTVEIGDRTIIYSDGTMKVHGG